jgi:hypothetical protein
MPAPLPDERREPCNGHALTGAAESVGLVLGREQVAGAGGAAAAEGGAATTVAVEGVASMAGADEGAATAGADGVAATAGADEAETGNGAAALAAAASLPIVTLTPELPSAPTPAYTHTMAVRGTHSSRSFA